MTRQLEKNRFETAPAPPQVAPKAGVHRPRVVWDTTFTRDSVTGTGVYTRNLLHTLAALDDWDFQEINAAKQGGAKPRGTVERNAQNIWWLARGAEQALRAERALHAQNPDLYHAAAYLAPSRLPCPLVVNVFDTTYLTYPQDFDWKWRLYARAVIPSAIRNAAAVVTLSNHARGEILRAYGISADRVIVVPPGIGAEFHPVADGNVLTAVRSKYGLGQDYLLHGGGPEPRKNVSAVIGAFALARRALPDLTLALFGPSVAASAEIDKALRQYGVANATRLLGYVPRDDLTPLYAGARAFVYASKLEGFGIPPVEAMACGLPVVAAPNPPMPEVLGDAAFLTADDSPQSLAQGIARVLTDSALVAQLRARGLERAAGYTWQASALKTISIYNAVLAERPARDGHF